MKATRPAQDGEYEEQREKIARSIYEETWQPVERDMPDSHWQQLRPLYLQEADAHLAKMAEEF